MLGLDVIGMHISHESYMFLDLFVMNILHRICLFLNGLSNIVYGGHTVLCQLFYILDC